MIKIVFGIILLIGVIAILSKMCVPILKAGVSLITIAFIVIFILLIIAVVRYIA